jgi:DNA ligase (NAD+)
MDPSELKRHTAKAQDGGKRLRPGFRPRRVRFAGTSGRCQLSLRGRCCPSSNLRKAKDLWRILVALQHPLVGWLRSSCAGRLLWSLVEAIRAATRDELAAVDGVGSIIADALMNWSRRRLACRDHRPVGADAGVQLSIPGHAGPGAAPRRRRRSSGVTIVAGKPRRVHPGSALEAHHRAGGKAHRVCRRRPTSLRLLGRRGFQRTKAEELGLESPTRRSSPHCSNSAPTPSKSDFSRASLCMLTLRDNLLRASET